MLNDERARTPRSNPDELTFKSIFDPREPTQAQESELWIKPPKEFDVSKLGTLIYSSKLHKKSKQVGIYISRYYFLFPGYLGYGTSNNPAKMKKYLKLDGIKVRTTHGPAKGSQKFYITFIRMKTCIVLVTKHQNVLEEWRQNLRRYCIMLDFSKFYDKKQLLGKGANGKVVLAEHRTKNVKYAVKIFDKMKLLTQFRGLQNLLNEIEILRNIEHRDIIKLYEVYESETDVHLVMEYVDGGDLQSRLRRKGAYSEKGAVAVVKNILGVLSYLHSQGLMHRDLKPANIVLCSNESDLDIKLIDFGYAMQVEQCKDMNLRCGTPGYVAPELLSTLKGTNFAEKTDIFSVGTIFYQLLTGSRLFQGLSNRQVLDANKRCVIESAKLARKGISGHTLDLLLRMLEKKPEERISAEEALEHPAFHYYIASSAELREDDVDEVRVCQTTKYSFDMATLKETNISSHSRILDTIGTFHVIPHISIDGIGSLNGSLSKLRQMKINTSPMTSRKGSENSSKGNTRPLSPESFDESLGNLDEERKTNSRSPSGSLERVPTIRRRSTFSTMQSPIHKAAIRNNLKKLVLVKEETQGNTEEDSSKDLQMENLPVDRVSRLKERPTM